jgi:hypothetical protein
MRHFLWLLAPAILVLSVPAQARPRDDALSGAFRCSTIAESRLWLDCYYGAAQPVRASLGMAPALAAQVKLASAPPAGGQPRDEAVRDEVMSAAANCIRVAGERPWLDCYYASAQPMRVQLGLAVPQASRLAPQPPPMPAPRFASAAPPPAPVRTGPPPMPRSAGLFAGMFDDAKPVVRGMPMQTYTFDKGGAFTVTLMDGQVWRQAPEDEVYHPARWRKQPGQMLVTISPGVMHTFNMKVGDESHTYKVRRIH